MKIKLINKQTNEEHICSKVVIDGFDYYVSDDEIKLNDPITDNYRVWFWRDDCSLLGRKKVIATNNPNLDIFQVVDNYKNGKWWAADLNGYDKNCELPTNDVEVNSFIEGYNKSQESHPFSEEDMIEFSWWLVKNLGMFSCDRTAHFNKELLQIWKEQRIKIIYYN